MAVVSFSNPEYRLKIVLDCGFILDLEPKIWENNEYVKIVNCQKWFGFFILLFPSVHVLFAQPKMMTSFEIQFFKSKYIEQWGQHLSCVYSSWMFIFSCSYYPLFQLQSWFFRFPAVKYIRIFGQAEIVIGKYTYRKLNETNLYDPLTNSFNFDSISINHQNYFVHEPGIR